MDVKDTGEVHCGRDVKDAINTARKKFNIAHSPVVADYGSINVVGLTCSSSGVQEAVEGYASRI